jgi:hypothetical protein
MRKMILISVIAVVLIGIGVFVGYWTRGSGPSPAAVAAAQVQTEKQTAVQQAQGMPQPFLATLVTVSGNTITIKAQNATTTEDVVVTPQTGIFSDNNPISWQELTVGELVAVVMYPPNSATPNVAQTITAVSGQ